jgi:hypothetical protein
MGDNIKGIVVEDVEEAKPEKYDEVNVKKDKKISSE